MFPLNFSICLCFLPTKRSPPWLVIKTIKTLPRMVQWRWAVACVAAAAEVGTSDSASDVPKSPSGWWKPRGKGRTYAYYMHIIYIESVLWSRSTKYILYIIYIAYIYIYDLISVHAWRVVRQVKTVQPLIWWMMLSNAKQGGGGGQVVMAKQWNDESYAKLADYVLFKYKKYYWWLVIWVVNGGMFGCKRGRSWYVLILCSCRLANVNMYTFCWLTK